MAIQSVIELLRLDPQKFHFFYYNQSTIQPENDEEPILVEAERLYEKMLENITDNVVTSLSDNVSYQSAFAHVLLGSALEDLPLRDSIRRLNRYDRRLLLWHHIQLRIQWQVP